MASQRNILLYLKNSFYILKLDRNHTISMPTIPGM
jgi:hypothetical protein